MTITNDKLDELEALAKTATQSPWYDKEYYCVKFLDAVVELKLIERIKAMRQRNKELENALDVAMTYIDNATVIDDLGRESLSTAWAALNKDQL